MDRSAIQIEKLTEAAVDELRALSIDTFYESFRKDNTEKNMQQYIGQFFSREKLLEELADKNAAFYFAKAEGKPVGYLKLNFEKSQTELKESNGLEIERIYILSELRGKNIGQLLFDKAVEIAHANSLTYLWLGVWEKNAGAIRFYERNGMVKFATHPFMLGDDQQTDHMMRKEL